MPWILRATGAAALTLALLAPTAAQADRWSGTDAEGDVIGHRYDPEPAPCGTDTVVDGAAETNEDITGLSVRHTRSTVVLTVRFRDLDPDLEQWVSLYLRSSAGDWWLDLDRFQDRWWRTMTFLAEAPDYPDPDDIGECGFGIALTGISCRIGRTVDFDDDFVRLAVPRKCLGNPRWVRVGADAYRFIEPDTVFSDDWDGGTVLTKWKVSYGPRVHATAGARTDVPAATPGNDSERRQLVVRQGRILTRR